MSTSIDGGWGKIVPICGNHGEEMIEMVVNNGPHSMFYSCPKYYPQNRNENERACNNRINLIEYQAMVDHLMDIIASEAIQNNSIDLTNYTWTKKGIVFCVLKQEKEILYVQIKNVSAMR